jgi:hypothetical protein
LWRAAHTLDEAGDDVAFLVGHGLVHQQMTKGDMDPLRGRFKLSADYAGGAGR